jgi:protein gp37
VTTPVLNARPSETTSYDVPSLTPTHWHPPTDTKPAHRGSSMSDLFHAREPLDFVRQVLQVMAHTPAAHLSVLTKRAS